MLAAGMGKRLGKHTSHNTKCMVEVAGKPLILRAAESLRKAGIKRFIIVTGYQSENLKAYAHDHIKDMDLIFVHNAEYESTNNVYSLYLAREFLSQDDTILLESDIIFEDSLIPDIVDSKYRDLAAVAKYEPWMDGTVTLIDDNDRIIEFIDRQDFSFSQADAYYKTVNIYKFSKEFSTTHYIPLLESYIEHDGKNEYYEIVLKAIRYPEDSGLKAIKLQEQKWYEIDDIQDLDIARGIFAEGSEKLYYYQHRFGGYWRYPDLKDFSLLVNPFFPPAAMLDKIKYLFNELVTQYPSNLNVQNMNAARLFGIDEKHIVVGNGASELIQALGRSITGRVAVTVPVFNEYIRCFEHCDLIKIPADINNYKMDKSIFIRSLDSADAVILVNPHNPTGSFLDYEDVLEIIAQADQQSRWLIIDESFIDFADGGRRYSLIDSDLLNKYPHLIVVKSLGKCCGIAGLRLGVLACGDSCLLASIKQLMPIWNINSLAEYYLQVMPLFKKDFLVSCDRLAIQRAELAARLSQLKFLTVYDSQANFILCDVKPPYTSTAITLQLLNNHHILIKDLNGKEGFEDKQYIRLAVKSETDNDLLIAALSSIVSQKT